MLLDGLHIPLTTAFYPDGRVNPHKLAANVTRYSRTPAAGIIVLGPSGEPTLLTDDETREVLSAAAHAATPEKVLIAGTARDSVQATLALADYAAELDYDAILVGVPSILPPTDAGASIPRLREILTWFQTVADRSPLPMILLSVPDRAIPIDAIVELAAHPHIFALLTTLPRAARFDSFEQLVQRTIANRREVTVTHTFGAVTTRMQKAANRGPSDLVSAASLAGAVVVAEPPPSRLRTRTKAVGFQILTGHTEAMLDSLLAGAVGAAPAFAASAPQACYEVYAAWKDGDQPLAAEKQLRVRAAAHLADSIGPAALKFAADLNGYYGGPPRLPHLLLTALQRHALELPMKELRN